MKASAPSRTESDEYDEDDLVAKSAQSSEEPEDEDEREAKREEKTEDPGDPRTAQNARQDDGHKPASLAGTDRPTSKQTESLTDL